MKGRWLLDAFSPVVMIALAAILSFLLFATVDLQVRPPIDDKKLSTAIFFAIQTITTTGYGGFDMNDSIKVVSCIFMFFGSIIWAGFVGELIKSS